MKMADGSIKADPEIKLLLKERRFKWKTIKNDNNSGERSEILEVQNHEEQDQMRKSKAEMFRESLHREDILKEPLTIYFKSMMTFCNAKNTDKQTAVDKQVVAEVQSQANIISDIMLCHFEANKEKVAG